ncbi:unnamed protein product [Coregonus sp. 'balchen']|nr:unnamed protein product [Coregonus sp. 'balchen']
MWLQHYVLVDDAIKDEVTHGERLQRMGNLWIQSSLRRRTVLWEKSQGCLQHIAKDKKEKYVALQHLSLYLDICEGQNNLLFRAMNRNTLHSLFRVAVRVLAVPASSASVERVFSHGGIILRPHRSQMGDRFLANLIFCKCNAL